MILLDQSMCNLEYISHDVILIFLKFLSVLNSFSLRKKISSLLGSRKKMLLSPKKCNFCLISEISFENFFLTAADK